MNRLGGMTGYGSGTGTGGNADEPAYGERGYRRRKLAAMAGNLYRSGQQAVNDMREQYTQTRSLEGGSNSGSPHIPGAFPDAAITVHGNDQMVLFPSYAKRHTKGDWKRDSPSRKQQQQQAQEGLRNENFWRQEWEKTEDEKAVVDVDVRGWVYSSQVGPMTRRNRVLLGLARQLSGISAPRADQLQAGPSGPLKTHHQAHEERREQERIHQEAVMIEKKGQQEKAAAYAGRYTEGHNDELDSDVGSLYYRSDSSRPSSGPSSPGPSSPRLYPRSGPSSPRLSARSDSMSMGQMTEAELVVANANLMARVAPFMTNPLVSLPITLFFYNDTKSQAKTVMSNDAGHFNVRAALDFVPTNVKVLANDTLSASQEVQILEPRGVSVISDIDDTIKRSNISGGAREIFRNTFVRELADLTVEGVKEWYGAMEDLGVSFHYCSNSPWQLFPVLASYFKIVGLPPGSLHLKQYSGMLQGIFEPVAERKRSTLNRLLHDFPNRKFVLVGDSGEADLEVYTELALENPGRILAVFIRDVTTPEGAGFFDPVFEPARWQTGSFSLDSRRSSTASTTRQDSAPASTLGSKEPQGPVMGTLIDFSEEPEETQLDSKAAMEQLKQPKQTTPSASDLLAMKKPPPPRPSKPLALRGAASSTGEKPEGSDSEGRPPVPPRKPAVVGDKPGAHPLANVQNSSSQTLVSRDKASSPNALTSDSSSEKPPPPPPRRRIDPPTADPRTADLASGRKLSSGSSLDFEPLPPPLAGFTALTPAPGSSRSRPPSYRSGRITPTNSPPLGAQGVNKKVELWRRRLVRAQDQLDSIGVQLYTWRKGQDVIVEALDLVRNAMQGVDKRELERGQKRGMA